MKITIKKKVGTLSLGVRVQR